MSGFYGKYEKSLDAKGRLVIPNEFRGKFPENEALVVVKWFDQALALFPESTWNVLAERVHRQGIGSPEARSTRRLLLGSAYPVSMDGQGRISIPPDLSDFAFLEKDLILIGDWDKIEIWDKSHFKRTQRKEDADINTTYSNALAVAYQQAIEADTTPVMNSSTAVAGAQSDSGMAAAGSAPTGEGGEA